MSKPKLLIVVGPTASGKTSLAISLAKQFNGEVISADSRQVYRGLDVGTAKVTLKEAQGIPHHLIDIVDIHTVYTATDFKRDATRVIDDITARGHLPIVAGGTFFYVDTLLERIAPASAAPNQALRDQLELLTTEQLFASLQTKDPRRAAEIDPNNRRRLVRALEIVEELGAVPEASPQPPPYDTLILGIKTDPVDLRHRLEQRARAWLSGGLLEEVSGLLAAGVSRQRLVEIGFEYVIGLDLLDGKLSPEKFVEVFIQKNWQYAKRQLTWLKRDHSINWISPADKSEAEFMVKNFLIAN